MKKILMICLILTCLFLVGCAGVGEAVSKTRPVCCCKVTEPYGHEYLHFSVCISPEYSIATEMGADIAVNSDPAQCDIFCQKNAGLA